MAQQADSPQDAASGFVDLDGRVWRPDSPLPATTFPNWREVRSGEAADEFEVQFPSAVRTQHAENNVVHVTSLLPSDRLAPVPAVILLHYWGATDLKLETRVAAQLNRRGIAAVLMALPYHLRRTPRGFQSGELAIQPDAGLLVGTMAQATLDVRRTVDWVRSRPEFRGDQIGIAGVSLGAIVAALAAGVEPRLIGACFVLGGADVGGLLWNSSLSAGKREVMRRNGYTEERLRTELASVEPSHYLALHRPGASLVIGARFDTVVPASSTRALIAALGDPVVQWLETGHYGGVLAERAISRTVGEFFSARFSNRPVREIGSVRAPTLRVGALASGSSALEMLAGIDLWRSNARSDYFASALIGPRGPRLFGGAKVSGGLSIGTAVGPKPPTWGVFWSIVL